MELASCLIIWGGWSKDVLMYNKLSLGFLYVVYKPVINFNVTPKNSTFLRLVFILSWNPTYLNIFMTIFLILSVPEDLYSLELLIRRHGKGLYSFRQWYFSVLIK